MVVFNNSPHLSSQNEPPSPKGNIATLLIALIALSLAAIFIKLSEQEISPVSTIFNRLWIAAIILGGWKWINLTIIQPQESVEINTRPTNGEILLLILVGILGTASVICWAFSLTQTSVANSTLMRNLSPVFTCLQGWLFFQQRFNTRFILGMLLALMGASLIGLGDLQIGIENLIGDGLGIVAAMFYALNLLILENLRSKFSAVTLLSWRCAIGAFILFPFLWLTEDRFFPHTLQGWLIIFALTIICQCFGQCILVHQLNYFSSSFIAVLLLLEPTLTAVFAHFVFGETLSPVNLLAFVIVLMGIFLAKTYQNSNQSIREEVQ